MINNTFTFQVAFDIIRMMKILNHKIWKNVNTTIIDEKWKETMLIELNS